MTETYHVPVMADETINALNVKEDGTYFDGTLGGGGHSSRILALGGKLIAVDRDLDAINYVKAKLKGEPRYALRYNLVHDNFKNASDILASLNVSEIDGAVLDLGISSHQVDEAERGFSYGKDGCLDMRMDRTVGKSALEIVNEYSSERLAKIIFTYGEEKFARRIADNIVRARAESPITTTGRLSEIVSESIPIHTSGHPAKKTFQALRIEVNDELGGLKEAICAIADKLVSGGRLCVITFHSLEDRIVKQTFRSLSAGCICDKSFPVCVCGHTPSMKLVGSGYRPSESETARNPRSKSATLRIAEKL